MTRREYCQVTGDEAHNHEVQKESERAGVREKKTKNEREKESRGQNTAEEKGINYHYNYVRDENIYYH